MGDGDQLATTFPWWRNTVNSDGLTLVTSASLTLRKLPWVHWEKPARLLPRRRAWARVRPSRRPQENLQDELKAEEAPPPWTSKAPVTRSAPVVVGDRLPLPIIFAGDAIPITAHLGRQSAW